ncbi:MAG: SDR family NAD(P)-dependent oxidoreductase [Saprospiraceae bacterium]
MKVLIIGVGPGIGHSLAKRFGRENFEVLMLARSAEKLSAFRASLASEGIRSQGIVGDLSDAKTFAQQAKELAAQHPDTEALIYNASVLNPAKPSEVNPDTLLTDIQVNALSAVVAAQAFIPLFKARRSGAFLLTGGGSALQAPPHLASLGLGKAALRNFAFSLAQECIPHGIKVATLTICGMVQKDTPFDPDLIAEAVWQQYCKKPGDGEVERLFK